MLTRICDKNDSGLFKIKQLDSWKCNDKKYLIVNTFDNPKCWKTTKCDDLDIADLYAPNLPWNAKVLLGVINIYKSYHQ